MPRISRGLGGEVIGVGMKDDCFSYNFLYGESVGQESRKRIATVSEEGREISRVTGVRAAVRVIVTARIGKRIVGITRAGASVMNVKTENGGFAASCGGGEPCDLGNDQGAERSGVELNDATDFRVIDTADDFGVGLRTAAKQGGKVD